MKEHYYKCATYLSGYGIEVRTATGAERLVLPDGGLLIADAAVDKYQPTGGVSLQDSKQAALPLSPTQLLGFTNKTKRVLYKDMDDINVTNANGKLMYACHESYYYNPNSTPHFT